MNLTDLAKNFSDEDKARDFLEKQRLREGQAPIKWYLR